MDDYPDLPAVAPNRALLEAFRPQGVAAKAGTEYRTGRWELHTHPDLELRLMELADVRSHHTLHTVYGLSCVAIGDREHAVAAAVAVSMRHLLLRLPTAPTGLSIESDINVLSADDGWYCVRAWQADRDADERLTRCVREAMAHARDLAAHLDGT